MSDEPCGYGLDHDVEVTHDGPDGLIMVCRECGAEWWEDPSE